MTDSAQVGILRRKARPPQARRVRDGASDLWRRLLPRLATDALGLELTVTGVSEQGMDLHAEIEAGEGALLLLLEGAYGEPGGLAVVDAALMTALIEIQTTGRVTSARREPRVPTAVDAALVRHALDGWFAGLTEAGEGPRWPLVLGPVPDLRAALLKLEEGRWTETRVDLDLGGGKREGRLSLYLPVPQEVRRDDPAALRTVVLPVETVLDAVLCRIRVPLQTVVSLTPGQLVPLPGVSVRRIGLEAPLGRVVAQVHLGQSRGFRAVRILPPDSEEDGASRRLDVRMDDRGILPDLAEPSFAPPGRPAGGLPDIGLPAPGLPDLGLPGDLPDLGLPPLSP